MYYVEECDTAADENRLWHVVDDESDSEVFGPVESPDLCEDWIAENS